MHNLDLLQCLESLVAVREHLHSELDPSIRAEFDAVIERLELCCRQQRRSRYLEQQARADCLAILGRIIIESTPFILELLSRHQP